MAPPDPLLFDLANANTALALRTGELLRDKAARWHETVAQITERQANASSSMIERLT